MKRCIPLIFFVLVSHFVVAQKQTWKWYFGANAAMDFSGGSPVPLFNSAMNQSEGCASIADENGNLLFYTDGLSVWNKNHVVMPNGSGMLGDPSSTQSALIVPKPGSSTIYYIFVTSGYTAHYSELDITLQGGLGNITALKNILVSSNSAEKLAGVRASNGEDIWVSIHENSNKKFESFLVTSSGVNTTPVISNVSEILNGNIGQLQFSPDGKRAAMASYSSPNDETIEVFDFDNATGIFSNRIGLPTPAYFQTYGLEFSPSGKILYTTANPGLNQVFQWNLEAGTTADIIASQTLIGTTLGDALTMQLGPDKKVYCAMYYSNYVGVINDPDSLGLACNWVTQGVNLSPKTCLLGLPNFLASFFLSVSVEHICFGDSTFFQLSDSSAYASVDWNFDDPASGAADSATGTSAYHVFTAPGTYTVEIDEVFLSGNTDTIYQTVIIYEVPEVSLGPDSLICEGDSLLLDAGNPGSTYLWSTGSTAQSIYASTSGNYSVIVSNGNCSGTDSVEITVNPCFDQTSFAASDTSLCEKFCVSFTDLSLNNPTSWQWSFPGGDPSSSTSQNPGTVCYNNPGTYDVTLITTSASGSDTLMLTDYITVYPTPAIPTITQNGYTLTCSPASSYQWQLNSVNIPGATNQSYSVIQSGYYSVIITDQFECTSSSQAQYVLVTGLENLFNGAAVGVYPNPSDGNFILEWDHGITGSMLSINLLNTLGQVVFESAAMIDNDHFSKTINIVDLPAGIYFLELKNGDAVIQQKIIKAN